MEFFLEREAAEPMIGEVREDKPALAEELRVEALREDRAHLVAQLATVTNPAHRATELRLSAGASTRADSHAADLVVPLRS